MIHELKIEEQNANRIIAGDKTFEVRFEDKDYQRGDQIKFQAILSNVVQTNVDHPINNTLYEITYVYHGRVLQESGVILAIKEKKRK